MASLRGIAPRAVPSKALTWQVRKNTNQTAPMISTAKLTLAIKKHQYGWTSFSLPGLGWGFDDHTAFFDRNNRYFHVVDGKSHAAAIADFSSLEAS